MMTDFWRHSGYHLLDPGDDGNLRVTDDFLRAYIERPEVAPVAESCAAERALHAALLKNPREAVSDARLAQLADADARENYGVVLAFRDRLAAAGVVEDCYLGLFADDQFTVPPLFVDQLVHVVLRGILDAGDSDPDPWRAMQAAVDRRSEAGIMLGPDERLTPEQALTLFTTDPAAPGAAPRSIEVGVPADLCLLNRPWSAARSALSSELVATVIRQGSVIWPPSPR